MSEKVNPADLAALVEALEKATPGEGAGWEAHPMTSPSVGGRGGE